MRKKLLGFICVFVLLFSMEAFAGTWQRDRIGWWYQNNDGSYPKNGWKNIDGVWYYFKESGYMARNYHTPDGYHVNFDGAWASEPSGHIDYRELINLLFFNESTGMTMEIGEEGGGGIFYVAFYDANGNEVWDGPIFEAYNHGYDGVKIEFEDWMSYDIIRVVFNGRESIDAPEVSSDLSKLKYLTGGYHYLGPLYED